MVLTPRDESPRLTTTPGSGDGRPIRGLEGVVAATTKLCDLDGARGRLAYQGYDIDDLAGRVRFEEVVWLLWHGELPDPTQLELFRRDLFEASTLPPTVVKGLRPAGPLALP